MARKSQPTPEIARIMNVMDKTIELENNTDAPPFAAQTCLPALIRVPEICMLPPERPLSLTNAASSHLTYQHV
jgi:hypothetical protein